MIEIKLTTKESKIETLLPNSWNLITCKQFLKLIEIDINNKPLILEVLTGVDSELWKQVKDSEMNVILKELDFLKYNHDFFSRDVKNEIVINNKKIKIPKKIEFETWGQKLYIEEKLKEIRKDIAEGDEKKLINLYTLIVSVYLSAKYYDKSFTEELAEEFEQIILNQYAADILSLGGFFFLNLITGQKLNLKHYKQIMKGIKNKQVLEILINLAHSQQ